MTDKTAKIIWIIALLACGVTAFQIGVVLYQGEILCLNEGCRIVEQLTNVPPLFFNLAGFLYFLTLALLSSRQPRQSPFGVSWLQVLLLGGFVMEGVLVGYQVFVARQPCSYCLLVFSAIVLLNLLHGRRQLLLGGVLFLAVLTVFPLLNFGPTLLALRNQSLNSGRFAVKRCTTPLKQAYFFFSSNCPHCQNVLDALKNCNSCEFSFNPIDRIESLGVPDLEYTSDYDPMINRLILSLLEIETIPVLLVRNPDGFNIIKGESSIIKFIGQACFRQDTVRYLDASRMTKQEGINVFTEQEGECNIQLDCPDPDGQSGQGQSGKQTTGQEGRSNPAPGDNKDFTRW